MEYITLPYRILRKFGPLLDVFLRSYIVMHWLRMVKLHQKYQRLYPNNYYLCKFEDLVNDPEAQLHRLCDFLEIDFKDQMLELSLQNSSLVPRHQAKGIDASAAERWRGKVSPLTSKWVSFWSKKRLLELGYSL